MDIIPNTREHPEFAGRQPIIPSHAAVTDYGAILVATDHNAVDYKALAGATLVVDTRNVTSRVGAPGENVIKA